MFREFALLAFDDCDTELSKAIVKKLSKRVGKDVMIRTTPCSKFNRDFIKSCDCFWHSYHQEKNYGDIINNIDPNCGNLRSAATIKIKGFLKQPKPEKNIVYRALACVYGLTPNAIPINVVTYNPTNKPFYDELLICSNVGANIINIATKKGVMEFIDLYS